MRYWDEDVVIGEVMGVDLMEAGDLLDADDIGDAGDFEDVEDIGDLEDELGDADLGDLADLGDTFREVLHEDLVDALDPEETDDVLLDIFESLPPAESFNLAKTLSLAGKGASGLVTDPTFRQIAATALPIAGGAVGTVFAPGLGTTLGSSLGTVAAQSLAGRRPAAAVTAAAPPVAAALLAAPVARPTAAATPAATAPGTTPPAVAGVVAPAGVAGVAAPLGTMATQAALAAALPTFQKALLATAFGPVGATTVDGHSVADLLRTFGVLSAQAAQEAEELAYPVEGRPGLPIDADADDESDAAGGAEPGLGLGLGDSASGERPWLLEELLDAQEQDLADAAGQL